MKITANPVFTTSLQLTIPGQDELATIEVTWKHKDRDALKEWAARPLRVGERGFVELEVEAAYLAEVVHAWKGPLADDGVTPVPFSEAALATLLKSHPAAGQEFYNRYLRALTESRVKN